MSSLGKTAMGSKEIKKKGIVENPSMVKCDLTILAECMGKKLKKIMKKKEIEIKKK